MKRQVISIMLTAAMIICSCSSAFAQKAENSSAESDKNLSKIKNDCEWVEGDALVCMRDNPNEVSLKVLEDEGFETEDFTGCFKGSIRGGWRA